MRILVAFYASRKRNGGMSRIMGFIHDEFVAAGHSVDYFCAEDVPARLNGRMARFTYPMLVRKRAVEAAQSGMPYDIINVHEPSSAAVSIKRLSMGSPSIVVTTHGVEQRSWEFGLEELRNGRLGPGLKTRMTYPLTSLWQSRWGLRRADHILCLNFEDRDYLKNRLRIPEQSITRIYPGADLKYASVGENRSYDRADRLLFAGTWLTRKGTADLVTAITQLAERHRQLQLQILGGGLPEERVLEDFPEHVRSRVTCVKGANETETAAIFAASDIFVLPSLFEGTPLTLIEAMMSGMPIVTTETCGMKDVIRHEQNGLLVPIRSPDSIVAAIECLIENRELRNRLGRSANEDALREYTWDRVSVPVLDTYIRLVQQASPHEHA